MDLMMIFRDDDDDDGDDDDGDDDGGGDFSGAEQTDNVTLPKSADNAMNGSARGRERPNLAKVPDPPPCAVAGG